MIPLLKPGESITEALERQHAEIERLRTAPWVFRCSCQIADKVAQECAARGWCKERKP